MGRNNRQRRAAKNRRHAERSARRSGSSDLPTVSVVDVLLAAMHAHRDGDDDTVAALVEGLAARPKHPLAVTVQDLLVSQLPYVWNAGWQPADVDRAVRRGLRANELRVIRCVIADEASTYEALGASVAPEWMGQLESMEATRWWEPSTPYLLQLGLDWRDVLFASIRVMDRMALPLQLPLLMPPPSQWREGVVTGSGSHLPAGLLDKVRSLLAKAESTTFDAEAEAFTAKAQELMARHRIDRAVLSAAERSAGDEPVGRRVTLDDPYADAKAVLIENISTANGGYSVWSKGMGFATVFAFVDELDAIEELFTSLLVQATAALQREGPKHDGYGRSRTTRFRRSFLVSFAVRIGERLRETVDEAVADAQAESGDAFLPILAARDGAVRDAAQDAFPDLKEFRASATDAEGWHAGRLFGDRADVGIGPELDGKAAS